MWCKTFLSLLSSSFALEGRQANAKARAVGLASLSTILVANPVTAQAQPVASSSYDWNPAAAIIAAVLGALVTAALTVPAGRRAKRDAQAAFLEAVAASLVGMAASLERGIPPFDDGHAFSKMIENYGSRVESVLGREAYDHVRRFQLLDRHVDMVDDLLKQGESYQQLGLLLADLRRTAGELRGTAAELRVR